MFVCVFKNFLLVITLSFLALTLSACSGGSQDSADQVNPTAKNTVALDNDNAIMRAVYLDIRTPEGLYSETYPDSDVFYSISQVKSDELLPIGQRAGVARYELSTDDFTEALAWSEQAANYQPGYKQLVDNRETDLYFEFIRVDLNYPQFVHLSRVFKNGAIDRSGVDLTQPDNYLGNIPTQTLSVDRVKLFIEYFWTFSFSNNTGNAVLQSYTTETDTSYIHIMEEAKLTTGASGQCDTVEVFEATYTVLKNTGDIWKYQEKTQEISSKRYGDEFEICTNGQMRLI